jgi:hypothetical protein
MATVAKSYVVQDADQSAEPESRVGTFPGTLQGLLEALDSARYRSAAGTPKVLAIVEGRHRQVIRRFDGGRETWTASRTEIRRARDGQNHR